MTKRLLNLAGALLLAAVAVLIVSPSARLKAQSLAGIYLNTGATLIGVTGSAPINSDSTGASLKVGSAAQQFQVQTNGVPAVKNVAPFVSSCGTSPSVASGNDVAGDVTVGTGGNANCTVTFASAHTNRPHCYCNQEGGSAAICEAIPTTTAVVLSAVGAAPAGIFPANTVLDWGCQDHL